MDAIERGMPKAQAARTFAGGISAVKRYATKARRGGPLEPAKAPGKPPKMGVAPPCAEPWLRSAPRGKGGRVATERDEFLRAAWRVMVSGEVDPRRLVFLRTKWECTPPWRLCMVTLQKADACTCRFRATAAATRRFWPR